MESSHVITGLNTWFTTRDNRTGRAYQVNSIEANFGAKIEGLDKDFRNLAQKVGAKIEELGKDFRNLDQKIDRVQNHLVLFGQATLKGLDGDRGPLRDVLKTME